MNNLNNEGIIEILKEMQGFPVKIKTKSVKVGSSEQSFVYVALTSFKLIDDKYIKFYDKKGQNVLLKIEDISSISQFDKKDDLR